MIDAGATKEIEQLERELYEKQQQLGTLKRAQAPTPVQDYEMRDASGAVKLSELFGDKPDLIVIHNMGKGCPYCTLWADGLNGMLPHLESRATFVVSTPNSPDEQRVFADSRGWKFRMVSIKDSPFTEDMGFLERRDDKKFYAPGF